MKILTAQEMMEVDRLSTDEYGVPSLILMENAGFNLFTTLQDYFSDLKSCQIAIFCGKGNNGGDGFVLARQLIQRSIFPDVYLLARREQVQGDAAVNLEIYRKAGHQIIEIGSEEEWESQPPSLAHYDIVVDALLGTGISKPLEGLYSRAVHQINESDAFLLAVDIPSGMFSDSIEASPQSVWADATVTFSAPKIAHVLNQGLEAVGDLHIAPIGTPVTLLERGCYFRNLLTLEGAAQWLMPRRSSSHKGTYGHIGILAGSRGKSGAAALAATAALRAGAGLVTAGVPSPIQDLVASHNPEVMTEGFPASQDGVFSNEAVDPVLEWLRNLDALGLGPGLTTCPAAKILIREVVEHSPVPLVLDADALNTFAGNIEQLQNAHQSPLILTPHPGEFARLTGLSTTRVLTEQLDLCRDFAQQHEVWLVLKTFRPLIATPAGDLFFSPAGNPGMATAGMGDVLTGVLTSWLGQRHLLDSDDAVTCSVCLAVLLHGMAGDLAAAECGESGLMAGDTIDWLGPALDQLMES